MPLATGLLPFKGSNPAEVVGALLHKTPAAPTALNPSLPTAADRIVGRCLAKRAADRYATAAELHRDLLALGLAAGREPELPPTPFPSPQSPVDLSPLLSASQSVATAANLIKTNYLPVRRVHLGVTHRIPGEIPTTQSANPAVIINDSEKIVARLRRRAAAFACGASTFSQP